MPRLDYEKQKEASRNRIRRITKDGQEIGPLPARKNPAAVIKGANDLAYFLRNYFPEKFFRPFGRHHMELIRQLERVIRIGGRVAVALPRGMGKTCIVLGAGVWAITYGYRMYIMFIAKNQEEAVKGVEFFKAAYGQNPHMYADFPEICYPLSRLGGSARKAGGQTLRGKQTSIEWKTEILRLPTVVNGNELASFSGSTIKAASIHAMPRGASKEAGGGKTIRPDFVIIDDPQDDDIARSSLQVNKVIGDIEGAAAGLAEAGKRIAMAMACTVIQPGDVADTLLDRRISPVWNGIRYKMLESFPRRMDLWGEYREIWNDDEPKATAFYKAHREEMDEGAEVNWEDVFDEQSEISSIQHAMNLYFDSPEKFFAERQNDPQQEASGELIVSAKLIKSRINGYERGVVPNKVEKLTAFVDVHSDVLYWAVAGWDKDLTGFVIDYGPFPKQTSQYFGKNDKGNATLRKEYPGEGVDEAIRKGLQTLLENLIDREFKRNGDESVYIDRILVDIGYKWEAVEEAMRMLRPAELRVVEESKGRGFGATNKPILEFRPEPGLKIGHNWLYKRLEKNFYWTYELDTNFGKTGVHASFAINVGDKGSISLWGHDPETHRLFADHCAAEKVTLVKANGREVYEFKEKLNRPDNHYFDCIVGCRFAASIEGMGSQL